MRSITQKCLVLVALMGTVVITGCQPSVSVPGPSISPSTSSSTPTTHPTSKNTPSEEPVIVGPTEAPVVPVPEVVPTDEAPQTLLVSAIEALPVAEEVYGDEYDRSLFNHWISMDGCDTRFVVLARDGQNTAASKCKFIEGEWYSAYDQVTSTNPGTFDIDHMVPLKEAWRSGAYAWDSATREAYANDLGYRYSLVAVTASSNRSKSDSDPANWLQVANQCEYVSHWTAVKTRWSLTVDQKEKDTLMTVAQNCGDFAFEMPEKANAPAPIVNDAPTPIPAPPAVPAPAPGAATDPQFATCKEAKANGKGPYVKGQHPEYDWYRDGDGDGIVCE